MMSDQYVHQEDQDFVKPDTAAFGDGLNLDLTEVAHVASYKEQNSRRDLPKESYRYPPGYDGGFVARGHRNAFSMLPPNTENPYQYYDMPPIDSRYYPSYPDPVRNEPQFQSENDPGLYSRQRQRYSMPLMPEYQNHLHISSSPTIQLSSNSNDPGYFPNGVRSTLSSSNLHSHNNSKAFSESPYPRLPRSDSHKSIRAHHSVDSPPHPSAPTGASDAHVQEHSSNNFEQPVCKLPYACRDFRNGTCTRGDNCKFMHSLDGKQLRCVRDS